MSQWTRKYKARIYKDRKVIVVRPEDPTKAIEQAGKTSFATMLRSQPYRWVGYAADGPQMVLDEEGHKIGRQHDGDACVYLEDLGTLKIGDVVDFERNW